MTDLDRTLTRLLGEELTREGDVIPPPLAELRSRVTTHRRRRWGAVAAGAACVRTIRGRGADRLLPLPPPLLVEGAQPASIARLRRADCIVFFA